MFNSLETICIGVLVSAHLINLDSCTLKDKQGIFNAIILLLFAMMLKIIHDLRKKD